MLLSDSDHKFMKKLGLYLFNSLKENFDDVIKEASNMSYFYKNMRLQSINALESYDKSYIKNKVLSEGLQDTYIVKSYVKIDDTLKEDFSQRSFTENNVLLYMPILEEWIKGYLPRSKDSNDKKSTLRSLYYPVQKESRKKLLLLKGMGI
jgi:hypothetical protein